MRSEPSESLRGTSISEINGHRKSRNMIDRWELPPPGSVPWRAAHSHPFHHAKGRQLSGHLGEGNPRGPLAPYHGRMQGGHPSAFRHYLDPQDRRTSRRTLQRGRKAVDAADQKTDQGRGKDVERKSPKTDFPSQLANPAHYSGFALSHRHYDDCWMILPFDQTGHFTCYRH
jgi:hypothetical protein